MARTLHPDTVGPVDVAVVVFDSEDIAGEIAPALADLQASGTVHVIDLALVRKDVGGEATFLEVADSAAAEAFAAIGEDQLDLLNDEDLFSIAAELAPGTAALVVVWENTWAARVAASVRASSGRLASMLRIPHDAVATALHDLDGEE